MRYPKAKNSLSPISFIVLQFIFSTLSLAQDGITVLQEKGFHSVNNYSAKTYKAAPQNWALLQDKRGVLYVGNNEGILEYDGVSWRLIKVANETNVRSLCMDENGRIFVGASGEIGYLESDPAGSMKYRSLISFIDKNDADFNDVWSAISAKDGVYFQTDNKIFRWNGRSMKAWNAEKSFHRIFNVNEHIFVRQREIGLMVLQNEQLIPVKGGEAFAEEGIYAMTSLEDGDSENILICTKKKGLYTLKYLRNSGENGQPALVLRPFKTQIDPFLLENISYHLLKSKSLYSVATVTNGAAVLDSSGNFSQMLNKQTGLQDETIYSQLVDASDNLWLATSNGLSKVNVHSPVTSFSDKNGLTGHVLDIVRHNKTLFVATNHGVSYLQPGSVSKGLVFTPASFQSIGSVQEECWDLLSFKAGNYSTLLGVSSGNIFSLDNQMNSKEILKCKPWRIYQSNFDPARVFIGLENGLTSIYWDGSKWQEEASLPELSESVHSIAEDKDGNVWLGHTNGVIRVSFKENTKIPRKALNPGSYSVNKYDKSSGPFEHTAEVASIRGEVLFGTTNGIYNFSNNTFSSENTFGSFFSNTSCQIHRMSYDSSSGHIWLETHLPDKYKFEFGYLKKESGGSYSWNITKFLPYSDEIIHAVYHDGDGITWFGGSEGLFRYDAKKDIQQDKDYHTLIRKVTIGMDSAIFNGTFFDSLNTGSLIQNANLKPVLPFSNNSIIIEFSSLDLTNERAVRYQYFLEGFDKGWSNWKNETKAVYTNLPEGKHIFHVRSKNKFNRESTEAVYEFTILPPWYRTWWAYVLYVLASIGFVWGVVTYSSRGLKAIIKERTSEIVKQKEVIEYKNRNITDSINYAKRIQEAILPSKELMRSRFPESFILYRPKDIVAGDFYWFAEKEGKFIVAACDCTGHGVPGAFMSLISYSLLNEVLLEKHFANPGDALDTMKKGIIKSLGQTGQEGEQKDGMDMSLVSLEVQMEGSKATNKLSFAGANNPLYLLRKGELIELAADKMPIGIYLGIEKNFTNKEMTLEQGDTLYLFSDGYADQFGGAQGKKFTKKRYKELLLSIQHEPMSRQRDILERTMDQWLGEQQQIDDVLVIGIRIS